jgi:phosphodiester glycosidase
MQGLHASFALNLDGGGSSTMVVQGKVVNEPSDGRQRKVCSAVLVIRGKDRDEAIGGPLPALPSGAPGSPPANDRAGLLAATDPGSTGGLAEAMAEGVFGPKTPLPRELRRALRLFRSAH